MPLQSTSGAASYDAFGGGVAAVPKYIEDYFSTFLFTGNASTQTITNGIDLSVKGGLVWTKSRTNANEALIYDTVRGVNNYIIPSSTQEAQTSSGTLTAFNSNGFTLGANDNSNDSSTENSVSWSIAKAPKFFDVVTWTGNDVVGRNISHNLGSVPGCIMVKRLSGGSWNWVVYHRSLGNTYYLNLNNDALASTQTYWNNTTPTSTVFTVGDWNNVNRSPETYVAYIFAHDAGGFGLTGTDNVISCGSYSGTGSTLSVTLGYEPQWVMIKRTDTTADWQVIDNMRGWTADGVCQRLVPNTSAAEAGPTGSTFLFPTATGFGSAGSSAIVNASGGTYIYIAIRRGPMKVPTSGTSVFSPNTTTNDTVISTTGFPVDLCIEDIRTPSSYPEAFDRLRGSGIRLLTSSTDAEGNTGTNPQFQSNTGVTPNRNGSGISCILWNFQRAPSFFDEVCYTGNGSSNNAKTHNLGVAPELLIIKNRSSSASGDWYTFHTFTSSNFKKQLLDTTDAQTNYTYGSFLDAQPTSTTFTVNSGAGCNESGVTYVAYLFATCAGVSKVGSYTGNGTTKQVDCGFTGGARFVLIKRTDSTGDWYVWDTARGIVAGNDPYLLLNSTAAETTSTDYIDTYSAGFEISSTAPAAINASGGTFIFLAIA